MLDLYIDVTFGESGGHCDARIRVVAHVGESVHAVWTVPYRCRILATLIIPDDQCYCMVIGTYLTTTQKKLIFFLSLAGDTYRLSGLARSEALRTRIGSS